VYAAVQEVHLPRVKLFDLRRKQPNGKKVRLGFVKTQDELASRDVTNTQLSSQDLEQIKIEVNTSKRKLN